MKTKLTPTQLLCLISIAIIIAIGCHNNRQEAFQHTRDSLIMDSLRNHAISDGNGTISTLFRSDSTGAIAIADSVKTLTIDQIDTTEFLTEHSEIKR